MPSVPANQCQCGPEGTGRPQRASSVHISEDRMFIPYASDQNDAPVLCTSSDGGRSFYPQALPVPTVAARFIVSGVLFSSNTNGVVFGGGGEAAYMLRTTDGGESWTPASLPSDLVKAELTAGYFMSDGMHGWAVGHDVTGSRRYAIETTDGGATWDYVDGVGPAVDSAGGSKLYSVFSPDGETLWIGGERGVLLHN